MPSAYKALVSSDWNECLAPCGPFDAITFHFPALRPDMEAIFRQYTGNAISLTTAVQHIKTLLPAGLSRRQMDIYLDSALETYSGVPQLIQDCLQRDICFMINTTGMIGYFQRILAKALLPTIPVLSAHPLIRYTADRHEPEWILELMETSDKAAHTAAIAKQFNIPPHKIVLIGDSGGDGPHFEWGAAAGAMLIGSMTKPSLQHYCRKRRITINHYFGHSYAEAEAKSIEKERSYDFRDLLDIILKAVG